MSRAPVDDNEHMNLRVSPETKAKNPPKPNAKLRAAIAALPDTL